MRKMMTLLLLVLLCLPAVALADVKLSLTPEEMGFAYDLTAPGHRFVVLTWEGKNEKGQQTLYAEDGHFTGRVELAHSGMGGRFNVQVIDLKQRTIAKGTVTLPQAADYAAPEGLANATVRTLTLEETPEGFRYSFIAPGADYMLLYYRSKQQSATFPVYPVNDEGLFEGTVVSPLTYSRTQFTVQVRSGKGSVKTEAICRKGWAVPPAPAQQEGRLSGVVVCIDPGHQENGRFVNEPIGPGLPGSSAGTGGMAQGVVTLRKEDIVVLETAMWLRDELLRQGATVVMTRETQDVYHTNIERCTIAYEGGAHMMLRLHCDNAVNANRTGIMIFSPLNSDYARAVAHHTEYRRMAQALLDAMKKAVGLELNDNTGAVRLNDDYIGNNWAQMPCFLVEMGYMSNPGEDVMLATPEYQQMLARGMADGVYEVALLLGLIEPEAAE